MAVLVHVLLALSCTLSFNNNYLAEGNRRNKNLVRNEQSYLLKYIMPVLRKIRKDAASNRLLFQIYLKSIRREVKNNREKLRNFVENKFDILKQETLADKADIVEFINIGISKIDSSIARNQGKLMTVLADEIRSFIGRTTNEKIEIVRLVQNGMDVLRNQLVSDKRELLEALKGVDIKKYVKKDLKSYLKDRDDEEIDTDSEDKQNDEDDDDNDDDLLTFINQNTDSLKAEQDNSVESILSSIRKKEITPEETAKEQNIVQELLNIRKKITQEITPEEEEKEQNVVKELMQRIENQENDLKRKIKIKKGRKGMNKGRKRKNSNDVEALLRKIGKRQN